MTQSDSDGLVSIITPAFQAESTIEETIASVQQQTYPHWEMLIVDDRSPDETYTLVSRLAQQDPRIRPLRHAENQGPSAARNTALSVAQGRYIAFLDSDDLWLPEKLELQLQFMREQSAALSFTQFRRISQHGERIGHLIQIPRRIRYQNLLKNTAIATSTVVVDRQRTGAFRMTNAYYDDLVLWLELLKRVPAAHGLPMDLMRYRVVPRSVSRDKLNSARQVWRTYREIEQLNLLGAVWYFAHYAWNGWRKYRNF